MAVDLQSGEFDLPTSDPSSHEMQFPPVGAYCGALNTLILAVVFSSVWVWSPPAWLQPSVVGMLWASLFLIGAAAGSVRRGSATFACVAASHVWLCQVAMQSLTSLVAAESSLVVIGAFSSGWLMTQLEFSGRTEQLSAIKVRRYQQWTIWDIALLTTLVAVICYGLPRLESPLALLSQVGFVLWGGCLGSWMAYRWVFDDCWTTSKVIMILVGSAVCFWLLGRQAPTESSILHIAKWMLTGPFAVVAAQGLTVLALLTAIRIDQGSLSIRDGLADPLVSDAPTEGLIAV